MSIRLAGIGSSMCRRASIRVPSWGHNLYDVYAKPSRCKVAIWQNLVDMARDLNAYNFGITSYNTFMFVVEFDCCDPDSGEWLHVKITPANNYIGKRI